MPMQLQSISLDLVQKKRVAILGYGNQGRVHALNLRDSKVDVCIVAREGKGQDLAKEDGFKVQEVEAAILNSDILMFLFADHAMGAIFKELSPFLRKVEKKILGFAHGFAIHFKKFEILEQHSYMLVAPKGAGSLLRENFIKGGGLPMGVATYPKNEETLLLAKSYAKAIGAISICDTTFEEETVCDLFGEQAVLCGGLYQLMEKAFERLVEEGRAPEMAFYECCYEAYAILDVLIKQGPLGMAERISPTAFFGGLSRGKRIVNKNTEKEIKQIYDEIINGTFEKDLLNEISKESPKIKEEKERIKNSLFQKTFEKLKENHGL